MSESPEQFEDDPDHDENNPQVEQDWDSDQPTENHQQDDAEHDHDGLLEVR
jgi:hypothetical protein